MGINKSNYNYNNHSKKKVEEFNDTKISVDFND